MNGNLPHLNDDDDESGTMFEGNIEIDHEADGRFPVRLHQVLSEAADGTSPEIEDAICFQPHGRAFMIVDQECFCNTVLPLLFPTEVSWSAFLYHLNLYGFRRLSNAGPDQGAFYHAYFLRGQPGLAACITIRRNQSRRQPDEPDLTRFPVLDPRLSHTLSSPQPPPTTREDLDRQFSMYGYEPTVGASTLPPDQFGQPVLVGLLVAGMNRRLWAEEGAENEPLAPRNRLDELDDIIQNALRLG